MGNKHTHVLKPASGLLIGTVALRGRFSKVNKHLEIVPEIMSKVLAWVLGTSSVLLNH